MSERIMVISHGHPDVSPGGAENAAYALYQGMRERPEVEKALFVAREQPKSHQGAALGQHTADGSEVLLRTEAEFFRFSQRQHHLVYREFRSLLEWFRPTIVHFHHYVHLGLEFLREVRNYSPDVKLVLTLHEFLAICANDGQMIKRYDGSLCYEASPDACHRCFPDDSPQDFFLREAYIKSLFGVVDAFVSPSRFLIDRYVAWGLPREKFHQIENGLPHGQPQERLDPMSSSRFGYFGQITRYKGLDVLLEALARLPEHNDAGEPITLDIHGARLSEQKADYQKLVEDRLKKVRDRVSFHGRYKQTDLPHLLASVDWLVIPSIWWENSPLVIQEAFANRVPIICSDIGGMAEKVQDDVNGLHFRVGDSQALADRMWEAANTRGLVDELRAGMPEVSSPARMAAEHAQLYARIDRSPDGASVGAAGISLSDATVQPHSANGSSGASDEVVASIVADPSA